MAKTMDNAARSYWARMNDRIDKLPRHERERWAYSIYWNTEIPIEEEIQRAALEDFGPDHPQAQGLFCTPIRR